jgi:hypothetical protein
MYVLKYCKYGDMITLCYFSDYSVGKKAKSILRERFGPDPMLSISPVPAPVNSLEEFEDKYREFNPYKRWNE